MRWPPSISSRAPSAACNCPTTTPVERAVSHCCATLQAESLVEQIRQTRDLLEPGPVGIVGFSVGGFMALVAATHLTFEVVVAVYPGWTVHGGGPIATPAPLQRAADLGATRVLVLVGSDDAS